MAPPEQDWTALISLLMEVWGKGWTECMEESAKEKVKQAMVALYLLIYFEWLRAC